MTDNNESAPISKTQIENEQKEEKEEKEEEEEKEKEEEKSKIIDLWNEAWNRSYVLVFVFVLFCLISNSWDINRQLFDGKRITPETVFNYESYLKKKTTGPCGWINAKYGVYKNQSCSGSFLISLRKRYGCYLSDCGNKESILCEDGWISREILSSGCHNDSKLIRHYCCRSLTNLCTWQGVWTSIQNFQNINCQFEPDDDCGKLSCNNGEHKIFRNSNGTCRNVLINGNIGQASCGRIYFSDNSDEWYKKVDGYAVFNSASDS